MDYNKNNLFTAGQRIAHRIGGKWEEISGGFYIEKIRGDNLNNIFISGHFNNISHYNGIDWKRLDHTNKNNGILSGIYVKGKEVFVVGDDGSQALLYHGYRK